ncbi:small ribosomal subunit protein uS3m-like isoform X2 [Littorina saxatilis]|uniref:Mitochondrial ribosomal protein S24 n=1 Tax=Littorina saxatilis TaxID=31220 RepID=A0AAN9BWP5_9CAEN
MAAMTCQVTSSRLVCVPSAALLAFRGLRTTPCALKNIRAGVPKATIHRNKPLTYEEAQAPYKIGVTKSWNSWHSANLKGEGFDARAAERTFDDILIRKFIKGTWPGLFASEVIVKRRHNLVVVAGLVFQQMTARKQYFLMGYSEEMLSYLLKCPVKLEIQTVQERSDVIFKKI